MSGHGISDKDDDGAKGSREWQGQNVEGWMDSVVWRADGINERIRSTQWLYSL